MVNNNNAIPSLASVTVAQNNATNSTTDEVYCFRTGTDAMSNWALRSQDNTFRNTDNGLESVPIDSTSKLVGLYFPFEDEIDIFPLASEISFYAGFNGSDEHKDEAFALVDNTGRWIYKFDYGAESSGCSATIFNTTNCCLLYDINQQLHTQINVVKKITLNRTVFEGCGFTEPMEDIVGFAFISSNINNAGGVIHTFYDDIYMQLYNTTIGNQLPVFNVTFDKVCMEQNERSKEITFDIDVYDSENDTIYYMTKELSKVGINNTIKFGSTYGILDFPSYQYKEYIFDIANDCEIKPWFNLTAHRHRIHNFGSSWFIDRYVLNLNRSCTGTVKEVVFRLDKPSANVFINGWVYDVINENETFNISFFDASLRRISGHSYKVNSTNMDFYIMNSTGGVYLSGTDTKESNPNLPYNFIAYTVDTLQPVSYYGFDTSGDVSIEMWTYTGNSIINNWTTTKPSTFTAYRTGYYPLQFIVSDDYHYDFTGDIYNYVNKTYYFYLPSCSLWVNTSGGIGASMDSYDNPFSALIFGMFGGSLQAFVKQLGYYGQTEKMLLIFYLLFLLFAFVTFNFDIVKALWTSSFTFIMIGYLLGSNLIILTCGVFLAWSTVSFLMKLLTPFGTVEYSREKTKESYEGKSYGNVK